MAPLELGTQTLSSQASQASKEVVVLASTPSVVPGTEILPVTPPSTLPPPPPPSQGMDFVLEQLQAKQQQASSASASSSFTIPKSMPTLKPPELPKVDLELPKVDVSGVVEQLQAKQTELKESAASLSLPKFELDVSKPLGATKELTESASAAASKASAAAAEAAGAVSTALGENVQQAADAVSSVAAGITDQIDGAVSSTNALLQQAQSAAGGATSSFIGSVENQIGAAVQTLPPPVRDVLIAGASAATDAAHFIAADPRLGSALIAAVGAGLPALVLWNTFGGFAGPLSPAAALEMLKSQDALLVDIRTERQRINSGVPELKRGARGKGVALPATKLFPSIARRVRNADALAIEILGAQLAALARCGPSTRLIIMDDGGATAKAIARAATAAGVRRVHIVSGGFKAWQQTEGLVVLEAASEYDASPLAVVGDAAESVAEEAVELLRRQPSTAAVVVGGVALAAAAVFNYHALLQYVGVLGIEASIAVRVIGYNSPEDALEDVKSVVAAVQNAAALPVAAAEKVTSMLGTTEQQQQQQQPSGQQQQQQQQQ